MDVDGSDLLIEFGSFIRKRVRDFVPADAAVAEDPLEVDDGMLRQGYGEAQL